MSTVNAELSNRIPVDATNPFPITLQSKLMTDASGTWTDRPIIGVNRMMEVPQPPYSAQVTFQTGGSFTGGTEVDLMHVRAASANNSAANVGGSMSERGLPAGTYYIHISTLTGGLTVNDAAQLIYSLIWEERP